MANIRFLVLDDKDNVAVALAPAKGGDRGILSTGDILEVGQDIPFAHKIAIRSLKKGERVIKYGEGIGETLFDINRGAHVHIHNIRSLWGETRGKG